MKFEPSTPKQQREDFLFFSGALVETSRQSVEL